MLGNFTMHRAQQSCSVQSWEEGWQSHSTLGTAPARQTPAGPCPCPTGWDAELAPAPPIPAASRDFQQQGGCRCLQDSIALSTPHLEPDPTPRAAAVFLQGKQRVQSPGMLPSTSCGSEVTLSQQSCPSSPKEPRSALLRADTSQKPDAIAQL